MEVNIKSYKPTSPGRRFLTGSTFNEITKSKPEKSLTTSFGKKGGRNCYGRVTMRYKGGGHKRKYRMVDFLREKIGVPGKVTAIEYDPNRSCRIALIQYVDGEKRYILAPDGLKVGEQIMSGPEAEIKSGNALALKDIPLGTTIHNIEIWPGRGGQMVRAAGGAAQLMAKEGDYAHVKLNSGEIRLIRIRCMATIGQVGNTEHEIISIGKAGRKRWMGKRPHVRGVAKNPVDHPMGGGEGKTSGGRHPCTPWGKPTKGYKTRSKTKYSDKYILKRA